MEDLVGFVEGVELDAPEANPPSALEELCINLRVAYALERVPVKIEVCLGRVACVVPAVSAEREPPAETVGGDAALRNPAAVHARPLGEAQVKGRTEAVRIFAINLEP